MSELLLQLHKLSKSYEVRTGVLSPRRIVQAVDKVDLNIAVGETVGLVGESGSGKSTIGQMVVRLAAPTTGTIIFDGRVCPDIGRKDQKAYAQAVQVIFQDPYSSLNPQKTVEEALLRPLLLHEPHMGNGRRRERISNLLSEVGLNPPTKYLHRYPHQMSGGERQRVAIARALSTRPRLIVADEAVSSLDVSIRAQLLNLLKDLQLKHQLSFLFITHDLLTLSYISQRVAVMYLGRLVEVGPTAEILARPKHPYTKALLAALPIADPTLARIKQLEMQPTSGPASAPPEIGCKYHPRCPVAQLRCRVESPPAVHFGERIVTCWEEAGDASSAPS